MNNKKDDYIRIAIYSLLWGFSLFFIFISLYFYNKINIKFELSISDFINIFIAIFISFFIPFYINKIIEKRKKREDILFFELNSIILEINELFSIIKDNNISKENKIDEIFIYIQSIWWLYQVIKDNIDTHFKNYKSDDLSDLYINFRWIITDDLRKDNFEFNEEYSLNIITWKNKLHREIEKIKFNIS